MIFVEIFLNVRHEFAIVSLIALEANPIFSARSIYFNTLSEAITNFPRCKVTPVFDCPLRYEETFPMSQYIEEE